MKGFTLVETLLVIGLFTLIFVVGLFMGLDTFHGYSRRSERDILVSVLERARSRAMANVQQHPWGVCFDGTLATAPQFIIFSGSSYPTAYSVEKVAANPGATLNYSSAPSLPCSSGGITFAQLTGDSSTASISITEAAITSAVSINALGRIDW